MIEKSTDSPFNIYDDTPYNSRDFYEMTKSTFINHPIRWFTSKSPYLYRYWISGPAITTPGRPNYLFALFSASGIGLLAVAPFLKFLRKHFLIPSILSLLYIALTLGPPYIGHLEVRYLVAAKLLGLVVFLGVLGGLINKLMTKYADQSKTL